MLALKTEYKTRSDLRDKKYAFRKPFDYYGQNQHHEMGESTWAGLHGVPPELIIVYYSAGADVNIHTTGHFPPLFPFVHVHVFLPQLMESVDVAVYFSKKLRICHTFELPSGNWLQHRSAWTSRWHKGSTKQCKLVGRKFEGVSNKSARRLCTRPRTFHLNVTNVHLFTRLDTLKLPLACCAKCQHGNKSVVIIFKHTEKILALKHKFTNTMRLF